MNREQNTRREKKMTKIPRGGQNTERKNREKKESEATIE